MYKIKNYIFALLFALTLGGGLFATVPQPAAAACGDHALLTFPAWYRGIAKEGDCKTIQSPTEVGGIGPFIWKIVLNILDVLLQVAGYLAVGFIIFGGFQYITSAGSADGSAKARKTITNAIIGLIISIASVAIVNLVSGIV